MNTSFAQGMARATELTQAGKLDEATALIQSLLHSGAVAPKAAITDGDVLEGKFTRLDRAAPHNARTPRTPRQPRKSLKETLRDIASRGVPGQGARMPAQVDLPDGAQFLSLAHAGPQGSRDYRLYIPANRPGCDMPLIIMLHGCTQSPEDFAIGTGMNALAEEFGCLIAYPAQPGGANAQKCWNWFRPEDQGRGRGEPAVIAGIVADILRDHPADAGRVYVAGLSAGGAAAAIMGAAYPEIFAAAGVHSGLPVGSAQDVPSAFAVMRSGSDGTRMGPSVPVIVFHGSADATVHPGNGTAVVAQALRAQSGLTQTSASGRSAGGRSYRQTRHDDASGRSIAEHWVIDGAGHAWAGGDARGSYTDPTGPDASREMLRFFLQHRE
ncbi:MAG: esterase [Rhodobacteraceae bacterium]|nr:MAG: esterase [Paracoccaceae bacterium]